MKHTIAIAILLGALAGVASGPGTGPLPDRTVTGRNQNGAVFTVTNQVLHPFGKQTLIPGRPMEIAADPATGRLAVLNSNRVDIFDPAGDKLLGAMSKGASAYAGVAFRPGTSEVWASEAGGGRGGRGRGAAPPPDGVAIASIGPDGKPGEPEHLPLAPHATPTGIAFSPDGAVAYVALNLKNTVAVVDAVNRKMLREIPVEHAPFGVAAANGRVFVANRGGRAPHPGETVAVSAGTPMLTDPVTGSTATGTVSVINMKDDSVREVPVGLSPSLVAASPDGRTVAVANAHADSVSLIDTESLEPSTVKIPTYPATNVGSMPVSVAFSPAGDRLYVACAGNNALAVLTKESGKWRLAGALPTGWFPAGVAAGKDGAVHLVALKGNADNNSDRGFRSTRYEGSLESMPAPTLSQAAAGLNDVRQLNEPKFDGPAGVSNFAALGIKHVILVVKENRTYDQVFGDIEKGNGDKRYVEFGHDVTPNQHALADQFVLLDNFYTTGAISFDGHQWLMMAFVSDETEKAFGPSPRGYAWDVSDSLAIPPTGFFWQGAPKPVSLRVYGEFCVGPDSDMREGLASSPNAAQVPGTWQEKIKMWKDGAVPKRDYCGSAVPALDPFVDRKFNSEIGMTDQLKTDEFLSEYAEYEKNGNMPMLSFLTLNNDHTNGTRPGSGTPRAMVADNDLAVGRLVERVSKSPYWESTLILVTEDDAQAGIDHVDGHRTICLAIGPHVKRGAVDSSNYNHLSMLRTIQEIFGVPARTRFVKAARPMGTIFTKTADLKPYTHIEPLIDVSEMNPPAAQLRGLQRQAAEQSARMDFSDVDRAPREKLNRIIWWSVKGFDTPYPKR